MIEIIRGYIRVTQYELTIIRCYEFRIMTRSGSNLLHEFRSKLRSYNFHLKFILKFMMQSEREKDLRETKSIKREKVLERENKEKIQREKMEREGKERREKRERMEGEKREKFSHFFYFSLFFLFFSFSFSFLLLSFFFFSSFSSRLNRGWTKGNSVAWLQ